MTFEARLWMIATAFAIAFAVLATLVVSTHVLDPLDALASMIRGRLTRLAALFTLSGRAVPLLVLVVLSAAVFALLGGPLWIPAAILASQGLSQGVVEIVFKHYVSRVRPPDWLVTQERGFSFPSGHACTAFVFFGSWLLVVMVAPTGTGLRVVLVAAIGAWMFGIVWSRIALGAHFITDVLGGALFGSAWTFALLALLVRARIPMPWLPSG
ncbi:MAG: phosphatase PAP2 family protein [Candidatus Eremiobacteraeota bacterium]|nr:phosphatase PAP2 family protein [Candidatus Eremiobacteraeota bacterium]